MIEDLESAFDRWVKDVWVHGNEQTIDELFDEDGVAAYQFNNEAEPIRGLSRYKNFVRLIRQAFTDIQVTIDQIASDGNKVVAVCTFAANRLDPDSEDVTVHDPVKVTGLCQVIFENNKIVHIWNNLNIFGEDAGF